MKVKLNTIMCGPAINGQPGDVLDLPAGQAGELIARGHAVAVGGEVETASVEQTETTEKPKTGRRRFRK